MSLNNSYLQLLEARLDLISTKPDYASFFHLLDITILIIVMKIMKFAVDVRTRVRIVKLYYNRHCSHLKFPIW